MLEIGTSGSVRGGDGDIPTYSAVGPSELIEALGECGGIGDVGEIAKEAQLAGREGSLQILQKQAAE